MLKHIAPNRIAVYLVALAALATALAPALTDIGLADVAGIAAGVAAFAGIVAKWLTGWQQYERAVYQQRLVELEHTAALEAQQAAAEAVQQRSAPGTGQRISLPR